MKSLHKNKDHQHFRPNEMINDILSPCFKKNELEDNCANIYNENIYGTNFNNNTGNQTNAFENSGNQTNALITSGINYHSNITA